MKVENAEIKETHFGPHPDKGIMTFMLTLDFGGATQGFGNYSLTNTPCGKIKQLLNVLQVPNWESLKGTLVRTQSEGSQIVALGHIVKDQWFNIEDELNPKN